MIRFLDILLSVFTLIVTAPILLAIGVWIKLDSKGSVLYKQQRVGLNGHEFTLYKFRTMYAKSEAFGYLTIGNNDFRITRPGYFLRKYKLDELPQLFNVLIGNMSFVGPRPEVKKYVSLYSQEERNILRFKPGITDYASIVYRHENEILKDSKDPEAEYIQHIMPHKLRLNLEYLHSRSLRKYFSIIFKTMVALFQ